MVNFMNMLVSLLQQLGIGYTSVIRDIRALKRLA